MPHLVLGYWKIRGLAQPLRHLLSYTGLEFQEVQYDNREKWFQEDKVNIGLDFPNIPYLIDGDFKLTESTAIAKYIPHLSGHTDLLGKTAEDQGKVDSILGVFSDAFKEIPSLLWNKDH
jgi:glutathione S-transferase